ncbi:hypothetical protein AB0M44_43455 [Streptosporangium subroseum]|uniref:hypothetical protein n=1 Tax=Streptosporangium subroseum TaxID=106412 RepID=UPI0034487C9A
MHERHHGAVTVSAPLLGDVGVGLRKLVLTTHITTSVGWLGAAVVFLAPAVLGIASPDAALVRAVYRLMEPASWYTLVPLAAASLLTGLVQSLGSAWGLLRHY